MSYTPVMHLSDNSASSVSVADWIRRAPKAVLHDHLDGGLRPATVVELARACGYTGLPSEDPAELAGWFRDAADSGSLERYLETFAHTCAVMQTREASSGSRPSAPRTWRRTGSSTPRCATRPSST